jgi:tetratricopeptide (TPR) repeat protein
MSKRRGFARLRVGVAFLLCFVFCDACAAQSEHDHAASENLGSVSFPTSCKLEAQKDFEKGVALLHSFAYSGAEESFRGAAENDPNCGIAHWGIAMTYFHQLWEPPIRPDTFLQGRQEIRRAQEIAEGTDREHRFIHALALFYQRDFAAISYRERVSKYEDAMGELAAAHPQDAESQVFYALALLASASPFDKTHAKQKHAARILEPLFSKYPQHPGIAHYLIHACDNQEMAGQGVAAARAYSMIAPSAPHALHMPSHIFTRLGMWMNSIVSNRAARVAAHNQGDLGEELHAMDYLVYAYLQEGQERQAYGVIQQLNAMSNLDGIDFKVAYAATAMPVRYAIERQQWAEAASIVPPGGAPPHVTAVAVWARAVGLARSGRPGEARPEIERLRELERLLRASRNEYWATQVGIQVMEAEAWLARAQRRTTAARILLYKAADEEDAMEKLPVTPGPIIPAREQLGDLLLEQMQPGRAAKQFQRALANAPNRRGALDGLSRAKALLAGPKRQN